MKTSLLVLGLAVCLVATPAMADLFTITYGPLETWFNSGTNVFTSDEVADTVGTVSNLPVGGSAVVTTWGATANYALTMLISNIGAGGKTADGAGSLLLVDTDSDSISANLNGHWIPSAAPGSALEFHGSLSNVLFTGVGGGDNTAFNGDTAGSASMVFPAPMPWQGSVIHLILTGLNFSASWGDGTPLDEVGGVKDGGMTAVVTPVPAAVLLGFLGFGAAVLKLRKFA
jgi:hypothetical protein